MCLLANKYVKFLVRLTIILASLRNPFRGLQRNKCMMPALLGRANV